MHNFFNERKHTCKYYICSFGLNLMMMKLDTFLEKTYLNPENNASFSSVVKLYKATKLKFPSVTLSYVKQWLTSQDAYTLHKSARRKFKRNTIVV